MSLWRTGLMIAIVAILPLTASVAAEGQSDAADALEQQVKRLIIQLDAPTRKERAEAERTLTRLGPDVLPHLPPSDLLRSVSVRESVRRLRITLERVKAVESMRPAQVTIAGNLPLAEILTAISKQSGNRIDFSGLPMELREREFRLDLKTRDFWPAVDEIVQQAGLRYRYDHGADRIHLEQGQSHSVGVTYSGPFRIAVSTAQLRPFPQSGPFRIVRINYRVTAEPRLRPLFVKYHGSDFSAKAKSGQTVSPFSPDARPEIPLGEGGRHLNLHCDFRVPAESIPKALSFHGKLSMTAAAGTERIEFTRLEKASGTARRRGGVTVKIQQIKRRAIAEDANSVQFRVVVSYDIGGPAFESHRTWLFHNRVFLQSADGARIERDGLFHTNLQNDGAVVVEYGFRNLKRDVSEYRFVYDAPTLLVKVPIEFDIPSIAVSSPPTERKQP